MKTESYEFKQSNYTLEQELVKLRFLYMRLVSEVWRSDANKIVTEKTVDSSNIYIKFKVSSSSLTPANIVSIFSSYKTQNVLDKKQVIDLVSAVEKTNCISHDTFIEAIDNFDLSAPLKKDIRDTTHKIITSKTAQLLRQFNDDLSTLNVEGFKLLVSELKQLGELRGFLESLEPFNIQRYFFCIFGEYTSFSNFGIQIIKPTARWNYYGDNQWTKPNTEALYISIPSNINKKVLSRQRAGYNTFDYELDKAAILTQYYQNFPSFFGKTSDAVSKRITHNINHLNSKPSTQIVPNDKFQIKFLKNDYLTKFNDTTLKPFPEHNLGTAPAGNDYDLGLSQDTFLSFGAVLMKVISALWDNEDLRMKLDYAQRMKNETSLLCGLDSVSSIHELNYILSSFVSHEKVAELHAFNLKYDNELKAIFMQHFDYECPWVFNIRLLSPDVDTYKLDDLSSVYDNNMSILNLTTIEVPHTPDQKDISSVTMALARYNATGPAYPFSCS
ncbi:hypothetical protein [Pseudoalteromonas luteoviolacea]|uniref:Uncharacterized protein n=1 Tax=Pseudoalteromonas luteoviolacea NCIMB 1942 TaxID=1365253 RepID=A0A166XN24_9GAMM|nr:hypothetical protein [Pseudoalteromonas luteoviolacea]KZN40617.1 hypothetical protein N482_21040 [Pseudoalteromonas luteoviolacea NCIMB 1942]KZW98312.1 hypothetical protein JL49_24180 [Pseudoalteromonas luteoviolacea]